MPRGSKAKYTEKQKAQAAEIEASYVEKGVPKDEAAARAWATVNKHSGGGERSGSGKHKPTAKKAEAREDSAQRAAVTRLARDSASLASQTKQRLLEMARTKQIPGRSTMDKHALIEALKKAS